jgi:hypothetical protein
MQDIRRVFADYLEYVNYIIDAMNNMYRNINAIPLIAYTKHAVNIVYEKVRTYVYFIVTVYRATLLLIVGHVSTAHLVEQL